MLTIISDLHLGCKRVGGTTPASQEALRKNMFERFFGLLHLGDDVCIAGDLFDNFEIASRDWLETYQIISEWLTMKPSRRLTLIAGNHDHAPRADRVSAFEMLAGVLCGQFASQVIVVDVGESAMIDFNVYVIAHCANQDLFDIELAEMLDVLHDGQYLILHANYNNKFAVASDHSLNVSEEVAAKFVNKGVNLVFAHEHQGRNPIPHGTKADATGVVYVMGNQIPSSIADLIGGSLKCYHTIEDGAYVNQVYLYASEVFLRVDWRELEDQKADFIRVEGSAKAEEAALVVSAISKFRQVSSAFVVSNAVVIAGQEGVEEAAAAVYQNVRAFNVHEALMAELTEDERKVIEEVLANA